MGELFAHPKGVDADDCRGKLLGSLGACVRGHFRERLLGDAGCVFCVASLEDSVCGAVCEGKSRRGRGHEYGVGSGGFCLCQVRLFSESGDLGGCVWYVFFFLCAHQETPPPKKKKKTHF